MERVEYAAIALSGDFSPSEMEEIENSGISDIHLFRCRTDLNKVKLKRFQKSFPDVAKILSRFTNFITFKDVQYPEALRNTFEPPSVIFFEGDAGLLNSRNILAIVGSRKADGYGASIAKEYAKSLSEKGITIVSGLAVGIDAQAHIGALEGRGSTIGVLGTGIDVAYPASNRTLIKSVKEKGCVISEFLPGTPPLKQNFPKRNRIISGLARAVFVVQATMRSGSLITARLALENGRDVFAVPGDINRRNSEGTNWLIKNGAKLISECIDIIDEFPEISFEEPQSGNLQSRVLDLLGNGPLTFGELLLMTDFSSKDLIVELTNLQLGGYIFEENGRWNRT
ncbi:MULTISPECIES: DNA-processing protein DprA [Mesotoga]|jgi:DNA processing protein|uniref:DNA-processing protein DprA n=1 Tax=Mesotoga TaxID=1184396 RepID=UPI0002C9202E|nr:MULTISPECIES: DNA-processing protein DprA [Mesotoga]MCP5456426.1 DNA-protecting protein DprA [Thermotogota bacterium]CCU85690.1 DNA protecting protein DprA [Mesotoga infera]MDK2943444.1 processing protein [Mesotoga sp.]HNQ70247.1 DNA-processing protein DprA [Mesotoga prima]HNS74698.1 DNA-processing protein DprA [Mesotoga prima]